MKDVRHFLIVLLLGAAVLISPTATGLTANTSREPSENLESTLALSGVGETHPRSGCKE